MIQPRIWTQTSPSIKKNFCRPLMWWRESLWPKRTPGLLSKSVTKHRFSLPTSLEAQEKLKINQNFRMRMELKARLTELCLFNIDKSNTSMWQGPGSRRVIWVGTRGRACCLSILLSFPRCLGLASLPPCERRCWCAPGSIRGSLFLSSTHCLGDLIQFMAQNASYTLWVKAPPASCFPQLQTGLPSCLLNTSEMSNSSCLPRQSLLFDQAFCCGEVLCHFSIC